MGSRHPDDLYKNGIQRSSFVPAIELLKTRFDVTDLDSGTGVSSYNVPSQLKLISSYADYRRLPRALSRVYYHPLTPENESEIDKIFRSIASSSSDDPIVENRKLTTWGRTIPVPQSTSKVAKFAFSDLCGRPYSAADYLEITKQFGTIVLVDVPKMGLDQKDLARRFITFIDACYESKVSFMQERSSKKIDQ